MDKLSAAEEKRLQLITQIQEMYRSGDSIHKIAKKLGKARPTIRKYVDGDPDKLCINNKHGMLGGFDDLIIKMIKEGHTQTEIYKKLSDLGCSCTSSNARQYIRKIADRYGLELAKHHGTVPGNSRTCEKAEADYIILPEKEYSTIYG
ncbi:MAG: hypothetical protein K5770_16455 [Lachnospiraceae bacterium]|nr:hypothetical protein [Lachnospiraceae bacterium]